MVLLHGKWKNGPLMGFSMTKPRRENDARKEKRVDIFASFEISIIVFSHTCTCNETLIPSKLRHMLHFHGETLFNTLAKYSSTLETYIKKLSKCSSLSLHSPISKWGGNNKKWGIKLKEKVKEFHKIRPKPITHPPMGIYDMYGNPVGVYDTLWHASGLTCVKWYHICGIYDTLWH